MSESHEPYEAWTPVLSTTQDLDDVFGAKDDHRRRIERHVESLERWHAAQVHAKDAIAHADTVIDRVRTAMIRDGRLAPDSSDRSVPDPLPGVASEPLDRSLRFRLLSDLELDGLPDPTPVIDGVLFQNSLATVIGEYGTYKTFLLLTMAVCIATGRDWLGHPVHQGSVVYLYSEGRHGAKKRLAALKTFYGITGSIPLYFLPTSVLLTEPDQVSGLLAAAAAKGIEPIRAFMVDTIARNMTGDESRVADMGAFIRGCDRIRELTEAAVICAHHVGWSGEHSRGSTALPGAIDTELTVEKDGDVLAIRCTKQKDAAPFAPITARAVPVAGSLALERVGQDRPELTPNETRVVHAVPDEHGVTAKELKTATELPRSSLYNALNRLERLGYVSVRLSRYTRTEAGRIAISPSVQARPTPVSSRSVSTVQGAAAPLGAALGLDAGLNAETQHVEGQNA